jgi:GDSL-like Lipase/Acylhydrolase family
MKRLAALSLTLLAGCSVPPSTLHPDLSRPTRDVAAQPTVVFAGDTLSDGLVTYAGNARWSYNQVTPWAESGVVLESFSAAIAAKPDIIHIMAGTYDVENYPDWPAPCGDPSRPAIDTCSNIEAMVEQAQAAGIQVVLATIPPYGPNATLTPEPTDSVPTNIAAFNQYLRTAVASPGSPLYKIPLVDYYTALANPNQPQWNLTYTDPTYDGAEYCILPDLAGLAVMEQLADQAFTATHLGAPK